MIDRVKLPVQYNRFRYKCTVLYNAILYKIEICIHYYLKTSSINTNVCLLFDVKRHFQQYFSYIVVVSFISGGNRRIRRKPPTCRKSLASFNIMLSTSPWSRFELTTSVVIDTDYIGSCKSNYHTITATRAPLSSINTNACNFYNGKKD